MTASVDLADVLLEQLGHAEDDRLRALAQLGRRWPDVPTFRGRCLEPAYLDAVASGQWTADDQVLLARVQERAEAYAVPRVPWRERRGLRNALRATAVSVLTEQVDSPRWQRRRGDLAQAWVEAIGALPAQRDPSQ